jgi:hypothetical protein
MLRAIKPGPRRVLGLLALALAMAIPGLVNAEIGTRNADSFQTWNADSGVRDSTELTIPHFAFRIPHSNEAPSSTSLVLSQVYGGGGNSGALYTNDFIEIFNPTGSAVSVTNWSVQYASAGGSTWQVSVLTGTITIQAGQYYLIREANGAGGSQPLPTPDSLGSISMSATAGKVALVTGSTALSCGSICHGDPSVVDYVGYGTTANDFEGSGPAPAPGNNNTSDVRAGGGCTDTDNNSADFATVTPPTPRNTSSPFNPCSSGTSTPTSALGSATATSTPTNTGVPGTSTSTSTATNTSIPGTATPTSTATNTSVPSTSTVLINMLYAYGYTTSTIQTDEAVRLVNVGTSTAEVGGWQIRNQAGGAVTLPLTATIATGQKLWIANTAVGFRTYFGFNPDYEYGADTDPGVPQASQTPGYTFGDTGGALQLYDGSNALQDTLVYGTGNTSTAGWSGPAVQYYLPSGQPSFGNSGRGQIFNRKLDEYTGAPVPDTNTKDDWAQDDDPAGTPTVTPVPDNRSNDDINGKKILHPGWALTNPAYEDMFFTKSFTDTNVTTQFLVDPDNGYDPIHNLIVNATQAITIETYEWHQTALAQDILNAHARGVQIHVITDGNPCCDSPPRPDAETLWTAQQWEAAGIPVYFFSGDQATGSDIYRYNNTHAKIMVVDGQWVLTGSDNFSFGELPSDDKSNGTAGARGMMFITNAPDVVAYTLRLINFDFQPSVYPDVIEYPNLGATPPPGYSPTPLPDMAGYTPVKPTPLVVTETENIEIIQSPDNDLRDTDSIIGLVNRASAGDTVMVEQQYERKYWETSPTNGPNPRLEAYIAAAQRGANVRIILDGFFEGGDCNSSTHNPATVAYVNGLGLSNLQAKVAEPAPGAPVGTVTPNTGNIHNKMVLASIGGVDYSNITSVNGSDNAGKLNREYGLQIQSNAGYNYFKDVFEYDWSVGYVPCMGGGGTPTPTPPPFTCNYVVNGDFETGSLTPWATTTPGITAAVVDDPVYDGNFSVGVTSVFTVGDGGSQGLQQNMTNIVGGATYVVGASVLRSASNIASARIRITWYPCPTPGTCSGTNQDMFLGSNDPNWQFIFTTMTAPNNALSARYKPVFYTSDGHPATIYFDDLVFDCNGNGTATPTPTRTFTPAVTSTPTTTSTSPPSSTSTITPTGTPTTTATATGTATDSPTAIPTVTETPSGTPTQTSVPTSTSTSTPAPTFTLTGTSTSTSTLTNTPTSTLTSTPTSTNTASATPTHTPSATSTPTGMPTGTPSPTLTNTPTGTSTQTSTLTSTPSNTPANTPTNTPTLTSTPTLTITRTSTGTATSTPTGTPTIPPTATASPSHTLTATPTHTATASPSTNATNTALAPTATRTLASTRTLTPTYTQTATTTELPATSTPTTVTPTTGPATATATACAIQFSDVPPGSTFYPYIRCLVCRGIISGYPDGTFRPNADVTRGQIAKIVSNAAGFNDPVSGQTFQDVPPGSAFYDYVQRLASRVLVSGYQCGGPGEPCGPDNLPYYRPNDSASRGQIAKIVSNAAGFNDPPGSRLFQDMPPGSPFYDYVQRLASRGIMQGYTCGGQGEPCVPPNSLHYFRSNNDATRGQTAKIVANTFFPECRTR